MDWGSLISSVLPTIGTVVGGLLGVNSIEEGVVTFVHRPASDNSQDFASTFYKEDEHYYLFNQSPQERDVVTISFPTRGNIGADTAIIPGRQSFDVTGYFRENGQQDSTQFELTAATAAQSQDVQGQSCIQLCSSGKDIPVGGQKQSIGAYLEAQVSQTQVQIFPKNGVQLQSLPMVFVQGSGDTGVRVMDAKGEAQQIVVPLPQPLMKDDVVQVEVQAQVQTQVSLQDMIQGQKYAPLIKEVDEATALRVAKAPRLNWEGRK